MTRIKDSSPISNETGGAPVPAKPLGDLAELERLTRDLASRANLTPAQAAVSLITFFEESGQLGLGQNPASLVGKTVALPEPATVEAIYDGMVRDGQVPDAITEGHRQQAVEIYEAYTAGKPKPTDPLAAVRSGTGAAWLSRASRSHNASKSLPSQRQAQARIYELLPGIAEAVALATGGELTTNDASCDIAAGLSLGKLRELGFEARLNDAAGHVTVRVRTRDGELIVDPTLMQFFADGSPVDRALSDSGGFVGSEAELAALLGEHVADWTYCDEETRAALQELGNPETADASDRAEALRCHVEDTMARLFTRHEPRALFGKATARSQRYAAFVRGKTGVITDRNELDAFSRLREEP